MLRTFFILFLCFAAPTITYCSDGSDNKSKSIEYINLFDSIYNSAEPNQQFMAIYSDSVIYYCKKQLSEWHSTKKIDSEYFDFTFEFIDFYVMVRKPQEAKSLLDKLSESINKIEVTEQSIFVRLNHFYGLVSAELNQYELSLEYYNKSLLLNKDLHYSDSRMPFFANHRGFAIAHFYLGNLKQAEIFSELELEQILKSDDPNKEKYLFKGTYHTLAKINEMQGDYDRANTYYIKELEHFIKTSGESSSKTARCQYLVGRNLIGLKEYDLALDYLEKAREIRKKVYGETSFLVGSCNASIGDCFFEQGDYETATGYYKKTLAIYRSALGENHHMMAFARSKLGNCLLANNRPTEALEYLSRAKESYVTTVGSDHPKLSSYNVKLVDCYFKMGDLESASKLIDKSIELLVNGYSATYSSNLPTIDDCIDTRMLLPVIIQKAKYHFLKNGSDKELVMSLRYYELGVQLIDEIQKNYLSDASKSKLIDQFFEVYEGGISTAHKLYSSNDSEDVVQQALFFSEKSKSMLLLQSFRDAGARKIAGISNSILDEDENLRTRINYKKRQIFEELQKGSDADKSYIKDLQSQLNTLNELKDALISQMEKKYPNYFQMKYRSEVCDLGCVRNRLKENQELIEFFYTDTALYAIRVNASISSVHKIRNLGIASKITQFRSLLNSFSTMSGDEKTYIKFCEELSTSSHQLFKKIVEPLKSERPLSNSLIIIPDGILSYIPFDALLVTPTTEAYKFKNHDYLVKHHVISYANSATLYDELVDRPYYYNVYKLLGVAPTFAGNESHSDITFAPLNNNTHELDVIDESIPTKRLEGTEASIENFLKLSQRYNIIHMATHAEANDQEPDFSYLAFSHSHKLTNPILYVKDIYGIKLQAAMVVLSACNSGTGKLLKGEGIMSLARSFTFAGAGSIITSLWEVDDQQASTLMEAYYKELSIGTWKNKALQSAKLSYLSNQDNYYCNPYFWATTIAIGDMRPINNGPSKSATFAGIGGVIVLFLVLLFGKLRGS